MANDRKWIPSVYYIVGTLAAIIVIVLGIPRIIKWFEPDLMAIAHGGSWSAPYCVEEELIGMQKVSHACESFKAGMPDDNAVKKAFPKVHKFTSKAISEIEHLEPCEADNVKSLRAMYTIEIENKEEGVSNTLILVTDGAKYVEYEKKSAEGKQQKFQELRDQECRLVIMGELEYKARITAKVWVIEPISRYGFFKIRHEGHDDVPLYIKTPLGRGWAQD